MRTQNMHAELNALAAPDRLPVLELNSYTPEVVPYGSRRLKNYTNNYYIGVLP